MSAPVARGAAQIPLQRSDNPLTARISPDRRLPMVNKQDVDPKLRQAAEGMETMFLDYLMNVMRQTVPENEMDLNSPATKIYQSMMDSETAAKAARQGGIGLADQIIAYMQMNQYTGKSGQEAPGGTHEGRLSTDKLGSK